jgi:predicted DCC family thiol-disulfide oxidoreductase YuxK
MTDRRVRPVLLYDGACGFCTRMVETAIGRLPARVDYQPFQTADLSSLGVSRAEAASSVQLVAVDGRIVHGSAAAAQLLVSAGRPWSILGQLIMVPPVSWVAEAAYRLVSRFRHRLPGVTPALHRPPGERPGA